MRLILVNNRQKTIQRIKKRNEIEFTLRYDTGELVKFTTRRNTKPIVLDDPKTYVLKVTPKTVDNKSSNDLNLEENEVDFGEQQTKDNPKNQETE